MTFAGIEWTVSVCRYRELRPPERRPATGPAGTKRRACEKTVPDESFTPAVYTSYRASDRGSIACKQSNDRSKIVYKIRILFDSDRIGSAVEGGSDTRLRPGQPLAATAALSDEQPHSRRTVQRRIPTRRTLPDRCNVRRGGIHRRGSPQTGLLTRRAFAAGEPSPQNGPPHEEAIPGINSRTAIRPGRRSPQSGKSTAGLRCPETG